MNALPPAASAGPAVTAPAASTGAADMKMRREKFILAQSSLKLCKLYAVGRALFRRPLRIAKTLIELVEKLLRRFRNDSARREHHGGAGVKQGRHIFRRDDAAD